MKVIKPYKNLRIYQVVDTKGKVLKEFDDYNYQKPFQQAKNYVNENSKK